MAFTISISGTLRLEWLARGDNSRPLHGELVDFLRADVEAKEERTIRGDTRGLLRGAEGHGLRFFPVERIDILGSGLPEKQE